MNRTTAPVNRTHENNARLSLRHRNLLRIPRLRTRMAVIARSGIAHAGSLKRTQRRSLRRSRDHVPGLHMVILVPDKHPNLRAHGQEKAIGFQNGHGTPHGSLGSMDCSGFGIG